MSVLKHAFPPLLGPEPLCLILGTLPGEDSLRLQQYYGHGRNQFWRIMAEALGEGMAPDDYVAKQTMLLQHRLALWDTLAAAERQGSLDSRIKRPQLNDVPGLLAAQPGIRHVLFNGQQAARYAYRHGDRLPETVEYHILPSTSPAHTLAYPAKLAAWQAALSSAGVVALA